MTSKRVVVTATATLGNTAAMVAASALPFSKAQEKGRRPATMHRRERVDKRETDSDISGKLDCKKMRTRKKKLYNVFIRYFSELGE